MKKAILTLLLLLTAVLSSRAALYRNYQTENGLSHNSVWAIMQDRQGFIWMGTNDGLNKFDGIHFKIFRHQEGDTLSLGSNFIHCLLELADNRILVGTKEGLYCYNREQETFSHIQLNGQPVGADKTSVHSLACDEQGHVWVGCYGQGIYRLDSNLKRRIHYDKQLPSQYVNTMTFDLSGNLWVGTDGKGLFKFVPSTGKAQAGLIQTGTIQSIYCDNNTLWVGASTTGLLHYDIRGGKVKQITNTPLIHLLII